MKKIGIILALSIYIVLLSISVEAVSVNCTYGVDFVNNSVWNITGNNITICDHENLNLSNVTITLQDNAQLVFNYSNVSLTAGSSQSYDAYDNSKVIFTNSKLIKINLGPAPYERNSVIFETYNNSILQFNNSFVEASDNATTFFFIDNSTAIIYNSTINRIYADLNPSITIINSSTTSIGVLTIDLRNDNLTLEDVYSNTTNNKVIQSTNNLFINITNTIFKLFNFRISDSIVVFNNDNFSIDYISDSNITINNSNILNETNPNDAINNVNIDNANLQIINSNSEKILFINGGGNDNLINSTNSSYNEINMHSGELIFLGNNNNLETLNLTNNTDLVTIQGNISPTNYYYSGSSLVNRSFLVRLDRPVAGYDICVLENLTNTSDCYYTNTTDASGEAEVYIYFQNSSDTDYLYIQYQNQSVIANVTADYLITASADVTSPTISINISTTAIYGGSFEVNVYTEDAISGNYTIEQNSNVWSYDDLTINNSNENETITFQGIYLPTGNWNITVTALDEYNNSASTTNSSITSYPAILAELVGKDEQTAYIGGNTISFTFNVTTKGYPYVKGFLNLSAGTETFNSNFASLYNGTDEGKMSSYNNYTGARSIIIPLISESNIPSNINMNSSTLGEVYQLTNLQMRLEPYSGLSAGDYSGTYGFGLDDNS